MGALHKFLLAVQGIFLWWINNPGTVLGNILLGVWRRKLSKLYVLHALQYYQPITSVGMVQGFLCKQLLQNFLKETQAFFMKCWTSIIEKSDPAWDTFFITNSLFVKYRWWAWTKIKINFYCVLFHTVFYNGICWLR